MRQSVTRTREDMKDRYTRIHKGIWDGFDQWKPGGSCFYRCFGEIPFVPHTIFSFLFLILSFFIFLLPFFLFHIYPARNGTFAGYLYLSALDR